MKTRSGFVSNSSSTSFYITNRTKERKHLSDFVRENRCLLNVFVQEYDYHEWDLDEKFEQMIRESEDPEGMYNDVFNPEETIALTFGDEHGTVIGQVYDYVLREGGYSESFCWRFKNYNR